MSFRERVLAWANGLNKEDIPACVFPFLISLFYLSKTALYLFLFVSLVQDKSQSVWSDLNVKRFVVYNVFSDAIGFNATAGPLGFRSLVKSVCVPLYNFLTPGTITGPLLPNVPAVRSRALCVGYLLYLLLLLRALATPNAIGASEVLPPLGLLALMSPFDFLIAETSRCEHYGYMLFCLAFSGTQWRFGCQCVQLALWFFAGVAKVGPWFKYVVVSMLANAQFACLIPGVIKALHTDFPRDVNPSRTARGLAAFGVASELAMGWLCVFGPTRFFGVFLALGFHTFIASNTPFASVQEWNVFCMLACVYLFGMHPVELPEEGLHPALASALLLVLVLIPMAGQISPARVPFLFAYRPYAGNWFWGWHVVSTAALPKLRALKTAESVLFEENDPESWLARQPWLKRLCGEHAWLADTHFHSQFVQWGLLAQLVQWPQYRPLVPLVELLEQRQRYTSADDYRLLWSMPFLALVHGWNLAAGWHMREGAPYYAALQAACGFDEGECLVAVFKPLGLFERDAEWCVVDVALSADARGGVVMRGRTPYALLESLQPIEMDVAMLEKYMVEDHRKKGQ